MQVEQLPGEKVIILECVLELIPGDKNTIMQRVNSIRKREPGSTQFIPVQAAFSQPSGKPQVFLLNSPAVKVWKKEMRRFLISTEILLSTGNATAVNVLTLIDKIKQKVRDNFHLELEPEIRIIGENGGE